MHIVADLMANCCTNVNVNRGLTSFIKLGGQLPPPPLLRPLVKIFDIFKATKKLKKRFCLYQ